MIVEREKFKIEFHPNGIAELNLKNACTIELEDSKDMESILKNENDPRLVLVISPPETSLSKAAKEYSVSNPLKAKAMAIIATSFPQKIIANFIMATYRKKLPNYPVKMFMNKNKAIDWLTKI